MRRSRTSGNKIAACLLILALAFYFQYTLKMVFGWSPDFVLGTLITFSFFLGFAEILFLGSAAALFLNWQPQFSPEILMITVLPVLVFGAKKYFPWRVELSHLLSVFFCIAVFYGISNYGPLSVNAALFLKSAGWTLAFSAAVFQLFNFFYATK